jgi:hypothetical protein
MSKKATAKKFDCVEMKRHIQERIYEETRGMKPDEFLAYMHQQVVESRFATFFAGPGSMTSTPPVATPAQLREASENYSVATDNIP